MTPPPPPPRRLKDSLEDLRSARSHMISLMFNEIINSEKHNLIVQQLVVIEREMKALEDYIASKKIPKVKHVNIPVIDSPAYKRWLWFYNTKYAIIDTPKVVKFMVELSLYSLVEALQEIANPEGTSDTGAK